MDNAQHNAGIVIPAALHTCQEMNPTRVQLHFLLTWLTSL